MQRLTKSSIERAVAAGTRRDISDAGAKGLVLRVWGPGKWAWAIRRMQSGVRSRIDLGDVWTLEEARDIAGDVDRLIRSGVDPFKNDGWLDLRRQAKFGIPVEPKPAAPTRPTWREAVDDFAAETRRTLRESTAVTYRSALSIAEFGTLMDRSVDSITRRDAATVVAKISKRAERQAELSAVAIRRMYAFLSRDDKADHYGVDRGAMDGLEAPPRTLEEEGEEKRPVVVPDGRQIGQAIVLIRDSDAPERDRLAALFLIHTAQRRRMVASARIADFGKIDGEWVWRIPAIHRKTAAMRGDVSTHDIPLPPAAAALFERARELAGKSTYLFPPKRNRRIETPSKHMAGETITHLFGDLGLSFSPHDVRRALATTYLVGVCKMTKARAKPVAKEILDHAEGDVQDVTTRHYLLDSDLAGKRETLRGWSEWISGQSRAFEESPSGR